MTNTIEVPISLIEAGDMDAIRELLEQATPGPWTVEEDDWEEIIVANDEGHRMVWGDQVRFEFEAGNPKADPQLVALAPELAADWLRMREALEKQLNGINLVIALADMLQPQTEAQQKATTLARALRDDLTRILEDA